VQVILLGEGGGPICYTMKNRCNGQFAVANATNDTMPDAVMEDLYSI
jgi:hypothetical protein